MILDRFGREYKLGTIFAFVPSGAKRPVLAMVTSIKNDKIIAHRFKNRLHKTTVVRRCGDIKLSRAIIITDIPNTDEFSLLKAEITPYIKGPDIIVYP